MDNFNKYLSSVELIDINMDTEHWTERVYIDKQTRKPIGLVVSPGIFMKYYIYFDETTCKELYLDPFDDTFHTFGINWFIYKGISEQDTKYGQELLKKSTATFVVICSATIFIFGYLAVICGIKFL